MSVDDRHTKRLSVFCTKKAKPVEIERHGELLRYEEEWTAPFNGGLEVKIEPRIRQNICINAHPEGCRAQV